MVFRTAALSLSKRLVVPQLSPTHTSCRILEWCIPPSTTSTSTSTTCPAVPASSSSSKTTTVFVEEYDPICIVECSPDFLTEANRPENGQNAIMILETMEEGVLRLFDPHIVGNTTTTSYSSSSSSSSNDGDWLPVGTELGVIDDGDAVDGDWTWQAYLHSTPTQEQQQQQQDND